MTHVKITPGELYYGFKEESRVLSSKIYTFTNGVRTYMDIFMEEVACQASALYAPRVLDVYPNPEMTNKLHLTVLIPYLKEVLPKEGANNAVWTSLKNCYRPLMLALKKMYKYLYAFKIIHNIGNCDDSALQVFFCWKPYEMMTLYLLEFMNSSILFLRNETQWIMEDEADIFDLCFNRSCAMEWGLLLRSISNNAIEQRRSQRKTTFKEHYPPPPQRDVATWCKSFMESVASVQNFKLRVRQHVQFLLSGVMSVEYVRKTGEAFDMLATYAPISMQCPAVRMAMMKSDAVAFILHVIVKILTMDKCVIPGWLIEMVSLHSLKNAGQLKNAYDTLCTPSQSWSVLMAEST